jgi:predicted nuclease of predicted toxin-antitoxin system
MQKYLLDENLSQKLVAKLTPVFPHVVHISTEGLLNTFDTEIWSMAKANNYIIITKDNDFSDMSHLLGCPPKVIKLNCGNRTTDYISNLLLNKADLIKKFAEDSNCYMDIF